MKHFTKIAALMLALMLSFAMCMPVFATEADSDDELFSLNLPNGFTAQQTGSDGQYVWINEETGESIVLTITDNIDGENITEFSDSELEEYEKALSDTATKQYTDSFAGYGIDASTKIVKSDVKPLGDYTALYVVLDTTLSAGGESLELYQYTYTMTAKNYIYSLCYTTQDEEQSDKLAEVVESFASLKIMDEMFTSFARYMLYGVIAFAVLLVIAAVIIIIAVCASRKKKKAAQAQFAQQQYAQPMQTYAPAQQPYTQPAQDNTANEAPELDDADSADEAPEQDDDSDDTQDGEDE